MTLPVSTFSAANNFVVSWRFVVVVHRAAADGLHRQTRLRAVESLNLALLVDA